MGFSPGGNSWHLPRDLLPLQPPPIHPEPALLTLKSCGRSEAARYARWSAAVALLLAGDHHRRLSEARLDAPHRAQASARRRPPSTSPASRPASPSRNSTSRTARSSRSMPRNPPNSKGQDASLLEDVKITIFGKAGDRNDVIHTQSCQYGKKNGDVTCSGDVRIDLMSAADAKLVERNPCARRSAHARASKRAASPSIATPASRTPTERVIFAFPNGSGDATGLEYNSDEGTVRLLHDVRMQPGAARRRSRDKKSSPVTVASAKAGPGRARQRDRASTSRATRG